MSEEPPPYVIEAARFAATSSPCMKSKRGVALFNREHADHVANTFSAAFAASTTPQEHPALGNVLVATGFNGPPKGLVCAGSDACRRDCAKLCMHAEQRAIWTAGALDDVIDLELVHVKIDQDGGVAAGGGPSCWQCSRLILEVGLRGVWLYEGAKEFSRPCTHCNHEHVYTTDENDAEDCPNCGLELNPVSTVHYVFPAEWRFYTPIDFHKTTLRNCNLGDQL